MKRIFLAAAVLVTLQVAAQKTPAKTSVKPKPVTKPAPVAIKTNNDSVSFAFGISLGQYLKSQEIKTLNYTLLNKALAQTIKGEPTVITSEQANGILDRLAQAGFKKQQAAQEKIVTKTKAEGAAFLEANKKRAGVIVTESGLQYEIIKAGTGDKPTLQDTVIAHYALTLTNGTPIESSYGGEPLSTLPLTRFVQGWTEALQLMPVGSKWKLYVPSNLAYGDQSQQGSPIPGGSTLVFEMELLGIKKFDPTAAAKTPPGPPTMELPQ